MVNNNTQAGAILAHMQEYGSITSMEAIMQYGITRLAAIICLLRRKGIAITKVTEQGVNRYGHLVHYARYSLKE